MNFKKWEKFKKILKYTISVIFVILIIFFIGVLFIETDNSEGDQSNSEKNISEQNLNTYTDSCNVTGIKLHGDIVTYIPGGRNSDTFTDETASEDIVNAIEQTDKDSNIKAIILEIDSTGGQPVADEEIANALRKSNKLTISLIRRFGASAAYLAATGAKRIFASANSEVGDIGITMSYLDYSIQNQKEGLTFNQISMGKYKDASNPNKPLTAEEKKLFIRNAKIMYDNFIKAVAKNRNMDIEKVKKLADGSLMPGELALKNGLIDQIGSIYEVKEYIKNKIGEDVTICW